MPSMLQDEHLLSLSELCERYETSVNEERPASSRGLTVEAAAEKAKVYGPNTLTPPKKQHWTIKYLKKLAGLFNLLLLVSGLLVYIVYAIQKQGNEANVRCLLVSSLPDGWLEHV